MTGFHESKGFTIVELLIVIVVIAILAAISVVAYNGIQNRTNDTAVKSDLANFHKLISLQKVDIGRYPSLLNTSMGFRFTRNAYGLDFQNYNVRYCFNLSTDNYILYAKSVSGNFFRVTGTGLVESATDTFGWGICGQIGLTETNPSHNGKGNGAANNNYWETSWVN